MPLFITLLFFNVIVFSPVSLLSDYIMQASLYSTNATYVTLVSPLFEVTTPSCVTFRYRYFTTHIILSLYLTSHHRNFSLVDIDAGDVSNKAFDWTTVYVPLLESGTFRLVFNATRTQSSPQFILLDDVKMTDSLCTDMNKGKCPYI